MAKKKSENIEQNTEISEEPVVIEQETIQKPKKKRVPTEKQKAAFDKLQEANKVRWAKKKEEKEKEVNLSTEEKNEIKQYNKSYGLKNDKASVSKDVAEEEEEEEEQVVIKKKAPKKKKKQKIIIEEDSSSDSENEIIIRRSRGKNRSKKQQLHNAGYANDIKEESKKEESKKEESKKEEPIDITPIEKDVPLTKKFTASQILKGIGL